jgi:alginate O-acetyltransferase complex protein AlgI
MAFNSVIYAVFLLAAWAVYWVVPRRARIDVLLVASYLFYATWSVKYAALMFGLTLLNYLFGRVLGRAPRHRRLLLGLFVTIDLAVLGLFKYWNFFVGNAVGPLAAIGVAWMPSFVDLILPLGISFFTFEFIHYLVDVGRGDVPVHGFRRFHVFAAFFPTQIAGPIKRFQQFVPNLDRLDGLAPSHLTEGLRLIALGWVKKVMLADTLAPIADAVFTAAHTRPLGTLEAWAGVIAFSFQILFDFMAYTDIARGSARLFGFEIPINFNAPYLAHSVSDFWRRWHISLSTWFRDYVFIPLGGSRRGLATTLRNLLITMALGGLWHGAAWNFVVWGVYWGAALSIERAMLGARLALPTTRGVRWLAVGAGWLGTQVLVLVGWVFFRAPLDDARTILTAMFTPQPMVETATVLVGVRAVLVAAGVAIAIVVLLGVRVGRAPWWARLPVPLRPVAVGAAVALALASAMVVGPATGPKFIYFQF